MRVFWNCSLYVKNEPRQSPAVISACFSEQFQPEIGCVVKVRGIVIQQNIMAVIAGYSILVLRCKPDFGRSRYLLFGIAYFVLQLPSIPGMLQQRFSKANVCPNTKPSHHVLKLQQHFVNCSDSQLASRNRKWIAGLFWKVAECRDGRFWIVKMPTFYFSNES